MPVQPTSEKVKKSTRKSEMSLELWGKSWSGEEDLGIAILSRI